MKTETALTIDDLTADQKYWKAEAFRGDNSIDIECDYRTEKSEAISDARYSADLLGRPYTIAVSERLCVEPGHCENTGGYEVVIEVE